MKILYTDKKEPEVQVKAPSVSNSTQSEFLFSKSEPQFESNKISSNLTTQAKVESVEKKDKTEKAYNPLTSKLKEKTSQLV